MKRQRPGIVLERPGTRARPGEEDREGTVRAERKKREKVTRSKTKKEGSD